MGSVCKPQISQLEADEVDLRKKAELEEMRN